jgi:hypothetical protein
MKRDASYLDVMPNGGEKGKNVISRVTYVLFNGVRLPIKFKIDSHDL